ncbi:hypothetical protein ACMV_04040 [Acidiphilium multivorum AIU301]|uniref:ParB-like N-terminal domain-containing protein n=1 Tax=Acidiphilium multivorum (strain DSM 11245 / JCM 8867 / NBRC 100883 / AIU 301) TaxID=926570 RepID=F0J2W2_ACIMA|nr:hypothetical protein ACMV_04040 [Acidiphilium multivorum AIU301]GAN74653.1 hypothetical protein Apmu_0200_05 [Acidiphilium multivorum AIU301]
MAATQKIVLNPSRDIPFNKLVLSQANVRRVKAGVSIEALAESIARRSLLQSLSVRPVLDAEGNETGMLEVPAGGRRYRALELLVRQKRLAKTAPIPCIVKTEGLAEEDSLAENTDREALHPLDQFRAFKTLRTKSQGEEEIAAAFGVTAAVVRQRLKLAAASPALLDGYAEGAMTLDQLMALCVSDDHARQEQVWATIQRGWNKEPHIIRRMLTEGAVRASDRRASFVGTEAYEAAGGIVMRDLFQEDEGGWLQDPVLLDRLVAERLAREADAIRAEGWKWLEAAPDFPYGHRHGLRPLPSTNPLTEPEQAEFDALKGEYDSLEEQYGEADELPEAVEARLIEIETAIEAFQNRPPKFDPADIVRAGAFISIDRDGALRVERGYVRPDDEPPGGSARRSRSVRGAGQHRTRYRSGPVRHGGALDHDHHCRGAVSRGARGRRGAEAAARAADDGTHRTPDARVAGSLGERLGHGVPGRAPRVLPPPVLSLRRRHMPVDRGQERRVRDPGSGTERHRVRQSHRRAARGMGEAIAGDVRRTLERARRLRHRHARGAIRALRGTDDQRASRTLEPPSGRPGARRSIGPGGQSRHGGGGLGADGRDLSWPGAEGPHPGGGARGKGRARRAADRPPEEAGDCAGGRTAARRHRLAAQAAPHAQGSLR